MIKPLSELIEALEAKFPEDKDVLAVVDAFEMENPEEEGELPEDMDLGIPGEEEAPLPEEGAGSDLASLFEEDMAVPPEDEDEDELLMPPKK